MSTITFVSQRVEERDSSHFLEFLKFGPYSRSPLNRRRGGWPIKVMLKITEIIVAKIKIFGQDVGILTKFAKQKNEANIQPF